MNGKWVRVFVLLALLAAAGGGVWASGAEDQEEQKVDEIQLRLLRRIQNQPAQSREPSAEDLSLPRTYRDKDSEAVPPKKVEVWEGDDKAQRGNAAPPAQPGPAGKAGTAGAAKPKAESKAEPAAGPRAHGKAEPKGESGTEHKASEPRPAPRGVPRSKDDDRVWPLEPAGDEPPASAPAPDAGRWDAPPP